MSPHTSRFDADQYRLVFDASPVALWLEDFTEARSTLAGLSSDLQEDIRGTLLADRDLLTRVIGQIKVVAANPAAVQLVGAASTEDLLGPLPTEIISEDSVTSLLDQIEAAWNGTDRIDIELEGSTFGGDVFDCMLHWSAPRVNGKLDLTRVVVAITDITERMSKERQILTLYEELERSHGDLAKAHAELGATQAQLLQAQRLESIGALAAGIAHEINTPIQYVGDNVRFLRDAFTDLEGYRAEVASLRNDASDAGLDTGVARLDAAIEAADLEFLEAEVPVSAQQALDGIARVAEIVRALKDFAHPGSEEAVPIDLERAIESTLSVSRNEWKYVAEVTTDFDQSLDRVPAFSGPLNQALLNIVVNAAHAIAEQTGESPDESQRGFISISTARVDGWAEIRITDSGGGIPEEVSNRVYDPFFTTKDVGKGSGQGLAIAHGVVCEQHGGKLWFESERGVGTTFVIRLPLEVDEAAA